eukprot:scaffold502534_cov33-Prasinocladus_malaysianus.AAC.1
MSFPYILQTVKPMLRYLIGPWQLDWCFHQVVGHNLGHSLETEIHMKADNDDDGISFVAARGGCSPEGRCCKGEGDAGQFQQQRRLRPWLSVVAEIVITFLVLLQLLGGRPDMKLFVVRKPMALADGHHASAKARHFAAKNTSAL